MEAVREGEREFLHAGRPGLWTLLGDLQILLFCGIGVYTVNNSAAAVLLAALFGVLAAVFFYRRRREREAAERKYRDLLEQTESQKLAAIGQLTASIAHEVNNPIAVIQGNLDPLLAALDDPDIRYADLTDHICEPVVCHAVTRLPVREPFDPVRFPVVRHT